MTSVIDELCFMKERYNFREVMFFDSILFTDKKWLKEMLSLYRRKVGVPFRCTGHVDLLDCETAGLLKDAGCYTIDFGVQSFNQGFRKEALNRREDNAQIRKAFDVCDGMRLRYDVDLMFGLPESSVEDYRLPLSFMQDNKYLNRLKCYNLSFYPRLSITQNARERGLLNDKNIEDIEEGRIGDWFHVDSIKEPAQKRQKEAFQKLYKLYPAMPGFLRRFVAKRDLHRAFRFIPYGLVIFVQFLIGLFKRDYRFRIYINNYLHHTRMRFSSSKGKR